MCNNYKKAQLIAHWNQFVEARCVCFTKTVHSKYTEKSSVFIFPFIIQRECTKWNQNGPARVTEECLLCREWLCDHGMKDGEAETPPESLSSTASCG